MRECARAEETAPLAQRQEPSLVEGRAMIPSGEPKSMKSLSDHVSHADKLSQAVEKISARAEELADALVGPIPATAHSNGPPADAIAGLIDALGANLGSVERAVLRAASALNRIGEAINPQPEKVKSLRPVQSEYESGMRHSA